MECHRQRAKTKEGEDEQRRCLKNSNHLEFYFQRRERKKMPLISNAQGDLERPSIKAPLFSPGDAMQTRCHQPKNENEPPRS